jgi:hypothetical protein
MTFSGGNVIKQTVKPCEQRAKTRISRGESNDNMRTRIQDEFTQLPISRQRKYQLRRQRDKRCTECGEPAVEASRCVRHLVKARERQRLKRGLKRRYYGTLSYKLEAWMTPVMSPALSPAS